MFWRFPSQIRGISCPSHPEFRPDNRSIRSSGGFQALKGHNLHSLEEGEPLHVVAGRHHSHREIGPGLADGADPLATWSVSTNMCSTRLRCPVVPTLSDYNPKGGGIELDEL
jgi:hypothetical protein